VTPIFFLALLFFLSFTARIILAPFLPVIERDLGITHSEAGFFFFLVSAGYFFALIGSGFVSSLVTHRQTIGLSCAFTGLALLVISYASGVWLIRFGLILLGAATGLYMPSAVATITSLIDSSHWGKALAIHEIAPNLAFIFAPIIAEFFLRSSSWRAALGLLGALSIIAAFLFVLWGRGGEFPGESPASASFKALLGEPSVWLMATLFGLGVSSTLGIFSMLPLYLVSERQMEQSWVNTLVALSRVSGPFMVFGAGWASDRLGPRQTIAVTLILTGAATLALGLAPTPWIVLSIFIQPALAVCFFPAAFAALAAIAPAGSRNVVVSFTVPFGFLLGGGGAPALIGVMGDAGSFAVGVAAVGFLILAGGALAFALRIPQDRSA
jgi:NNP family nitrate/nitrite transporter-like MFS transporter